MTKRAQNRASRTGLSEEARNALVLPLNELLSDLHIQYTKTRNYHWNVTGDQFFQLHSVFEEQYTELASDIDEVAERVRTLGGIAFGSMATFLKHGRLKEDDTVPDGNGMVESLLIGYESLIGSFRKLAEKAAEVEDVSTEDFAIGIIEKYEKTAWMLRSYLG
jgi:starvation-inducible DNA-binding protein